MAIAPPVGPPAPQGRGLGMAIALPVGPPAPQGRGIATARSDFQRARSGGPSLVKVPVMDLKLYVIPGSHPCATVEAALDLKGLGYERVDLLPGFSAVIQL